LQSWCLKNALTRCGSQFLLDAASITTTTDRYGDVVTDEMTAASSKVEGQADHVGS
jgi:hypothetical protein